MPELVAELTTPTYTFMGGVFVLEDKAMIKKRLGRSPDLADALETFAIPDVPNDALQRYSRRATAVSDFDPYAPPAESDFDPYEDRDR